MPNHIHLIAVPQAKDSLAIGIGRAHSQYSQTVNFREGWKGHLWQGRFASFVMDSEHLVNAARYIELNPVRAGLTDRADKWPYSSATAHVHRRDPLVKTVPLLEMVPKWDEWLSLEVADKELDTFRLHAQTGMPLRNDDFISKLEALKGRALTPQKPGQKNN